MTLHDDTIRLLMNLINQAAAFERPILLDTGSEQQRHWVHTAIEVLNVVRHTERQILPSCITPGVADDFPDDLEGELINLGIQYGKHDDVSSELRDFILALERDTDQGSMVSVDEVVDLILESHGHTDRESAPLVGKIQLISAGCRVCQLLMGTDNRVGLLAELNAATIVRNRLGAPQFNDRMRFIANRCLESIDRESFAELIEEYNGDSSNSISLPPLREVACMAWINGVSAVSSECLSASQGALGVSDDELRRSLLDAADEVTDVMAMADEFGQPHFVTMSRCIRLYQKRAEVALGADMEQFLQILDQYGANECGQLVRFIQDNEPCPVLADFMESEVAEHFA